MFLTPRLVACLATAWLVLAPVGRAQRQAPQDGPVAGPVAVARFKASPATGDAPLTVRFRDHSLGTLTSWRWDFGDGTTSTEREPTHVYTGGGLYTVRLTVKGPGGSDVVEKPGGVIVRRCAPGNARENRVTPLERGEDFVPVTGDDGLGFYCVYSGKGVPNGPGIANNVGIFLFPLVNGEVLVFGSGYGDPNSIVTPTEDAAFDARRIDELLRFCLGKSPSGTPLRFVAPHGHIDHINADLLRELRARGYPVVDIVFHGADAPLVRSLPGWTDADKALFHSLRNTTNQCQEPLLSYDSPLGKIWFFLRDGHTAGSIDLVLDVRNDAGNRFVVRGSGAAFGACPVPGVREAIEPHGNMALHAPEPKLLAFGPNSASSLGGTTVVLSGTDFAASLAGPPTVLFDGVAATAVAVLDNATITCVAPPGIPGDLVGVRVINRNGQTSLGGFRYRDIPTIEDVFPARGLASGGTPVTVTGSGFLNDAPGPNTITFRGVPATAVHVIDDRTLTCLTPANAAGLARVAISNVNGSFERVAAFRYDPLIDVVSISPANGSALGGTSVQITGTAFAVGAAVPEVRFGNKLATEVVRVSDTRITCRSPSGPGGTNVDVRVSGENGSDVLTGGFRYFLQPRVDSVAPPDGPAAGGTVVTLSGSQFTKNNAGANSVTIGGVPATNVVTLSDTRLTCRVPAGAPGTLADVTVSNVNGIGTLSEGFRYRRFPQPTAIDPPLGPRAGGTRVRVQGSGFAESGAGTTQVRFGGVLALDLIIEGDTSLTCLVPGAAADGAVDLELVNANGSGLLPRAFRYVTRPALLGLDPAVGPGDRATLVTLHGSGFRAMGAGATEVRFGGRVADLVRVLDDGTVTCRAPLGLTPGSVDVRLVNANGAALLPAAFRTLAAPALFSVAPGVGVTAGGDRVVLRGTGFLPGPVSVSFGGNEASGLVVSSDGRLEVTTPPGASGVVDVSLRTPGGTARLLDAFVYGAGTPTLTSLTPASGAAVGGTPVELRGTNLGGPRGNPPSISFGGHPATSVATVNDGLLTCLAPAGAPGTRVDVRVQNENGVALLSGGYRYHLQPTLTSVSPSVGSPLGGLLVTLRGSGFQADQAGAIGVRFGAESAADVTVVDDGTLTCRVPTGPPGSQVDVELTSANGAARLALAFRYREAPRLVSVAPASGPLVGGTPVTLSGSGFSAGGAAVTSVRFGGVAASGLTIVSDTTITCNAPAGGAAGSADVRVSNGNGTSTLAAAWRYHAGPTLASLAPASGTSLGGTELVLTGSGFLADEPGPSGVLFGGVPAASVTTLDDTRLRVTAPPGVAGTQVDVALANANGAAELLAAFRYHALPRIDSIDPPGARSAGGTTVTLRGAGFTADAAGANSVTFGASAATAISVLSDTTLTCQVPAGSGSVSVALANRNGGAVTDTPFVYFPPPRLDELLPPQGFSGGGNLVELHGEGWLANGAGVNTVRFAGALASEVTVLDDGALRCRAPAGVAGPVAVQVDNANGTSVLVDGYYYDWAPTLTGILPAQGSSLGGTEVTLSGGGFNTVGAGPLSVRFGAALATNVRVLDGGTLLCNAPPGPPGTLVNVVVSNPRGSSLLSGFRYHARPSITSIDPAVGPPEGGTLVTLRGTGFTANGAGVTTVRFGASGATGITLVDDTTLRCTAPPGPARTSATVTLTNANGTGTFVDGFRWMLRQASDLNDDGVGDAVLCAGDGVHLFFGATLGLADESTATADLFLRGSLANTDFGAGACSGDLNGDQVPDLVVTAPGDDAGGTDSGAVYVFFGPLASSPTARFSGSANAIFRGASSGDRFGTSVALADLDGDGQGDLIVGAPLNDLGGTDGGAAYVYRGGPTFRGQTTAQATVRLLASGSRHSFGEAIGAGDLTGDGLVDVAIGAPLEGGSGGSSGVAYVFRGGPSLTSASADSALARLLGEGSGDHFGTSVLVADFDGDGTGDLFIGAPDAKSAGVQGGLLYAFRGGTISSGSAASANARLEPESSGDRLGQVLAAGDANDDGRMDLLVGAPLHDVPAGNGGRAYLLLGGPLASGSVAQRANLILLAENSSGDAFGTGLGFSDIDGDGRGDLLVGSPFSNGGGADSGRSHVFFGAALQATRSAGADDVTFTGSSAGLQLGRAVAGP